jgi:protein ImuA
MIDQLRQRLQALQRGAGIAEDPGALPLGIAAIDLAFGGGLARGALHEIAAASEAHLAAATGFALALAARRQATVFWIAGDMALAESGAPHGPGLDAFGLAPERLVTVCAARPRDLLWVMEEVLRCRAVGVAIGEWRHGEIDMVAMRRLSLAAATSGALALLLRAAPPREASTAATRWIVGASPSPGGGAEKKDCFSVNLVRNRRGPAGSWILQWSDSDERFVPATPAQPVAAPTRDRPHRKVA